MRQRLKYTLILVAGLILLIIVVPLTLVTDFRGM